jgi:hypothetical protein
MRSNAIAVALTLAGLMAGTAPVLADTMKFMAELSPKSEVPPHPDLKGSGTITATLDTSSLKLTYHLEFKDLTGKAVAAHFHGPAGPGANAGVQVPVAGGINSPMEGSATLTNDQAKMLEDGQMYFNVHTEANKGGEIRGQMMKM